MKKFKKRQYFLATVESCTGGLVSHRITNVSGSSEIFYGAFITYTNEAKIALGVPRELIAQFGAVSREVATAMAERGLAQMKAAILQTRSAQDIRGFACISITGFAGPSSTPSETAGTCFLGVAVSDQATLVEEFHAKSTARSRIRVKTEFAQRAFELLEQCPLSEAT